MTDLVDLFNNPTCAFRGKPFWSWNGKLDLQELLRQVHIFKEMGFGGFFMHSRTGLATDYLGDEWMALTNACADEAAKLGMEAWLYDEDRWPSGTAGGLVTSDIQHAQKFISLRFCSMADFVWDDGILAAFVGDINGLAVRNCQRLGRSEKVPALSAELLNGHGEKWKVLVFRIETAEPSSFYNGYTYVDTMSKDATDRFVALTHERYRQHCGERLGGTIRGIFTDEPHRGPVMCGFSLSNQNRLWMAPWTPTLFSEFRAAFGYELVDRLPELFLQANGCAVSPVKWHYMEMLQRLFLRNFAQPIFDWCGKHRMQLTGHVLHEDSLTAQAAMQGSLMRFYEHMHLPGIDVLAEGNRNYWVAKQLSSVARQLGQKWLLSELYGCTGWQMTFESHKAVGDWQALFGINVRCHHLSWYTMEGEAKRDYPASISYQSAWFKEYRHVEDYFSRLGVFASVGRPCCEVLVINPVESVWCQIHGGWAEGLTAKEAAVKQLEQAYADLFHWLAGSQLDFDYGDEEMMSRLAGVEHTSSGVVLRLGAAEYRVVVVGKMTTMRSSTVALLGRFADAGGAVVFAGDPPSHVDAVQSCAASDLSARAIAVSWSAAAVVEAVAASVTSPRVTITDAHGIAARDIYCQLRIDGDGQQFLIAVNVDPEQAATNLQIRLTRGGQVAEWDCETGERYSVNARRAGEGIEFSADFAPSGSRTYVIGTGVDEGLSLRPVYSDFKRQTCGGGFKFELSEPNVLVLDRARYQIGNQAGNDEWRSATDILKIDRAVRTAFGLPWRSGEMVQPWFKSRTQPQPMAQGRVRLRFDFNITELPSSPVELGIERPELFNVWMNGRAVDTSTVTGFWVDHAICRLPLLADALRLGPNEIALEVEFRETVNFEAIYLLGQFGVSVDEQSASITRLPATLTPSDVVNQGLPFYGGSIRYRLAIQPSSISAGHRWLLELPSVACACVKVWAKGHAPRILAWQPFQVDVTDMLPSSNETGSAYELIVELVLTRRNTFGPLHQLPVRAPHYGPESFTTTGDAWSQSPLLYPAGMLEAPILVEACPEHAAGQGQAAEMRARRAAFSDLSPVFVE